MFSVVCMKENLAVSNWINNNSWTHTGECMAEKQKLPWCGSSCCAFVCEP